MIHATEVVLSNGGSVLVRETPEQIRQALEIPNGSDFIALHDIDNEEHTLYVRTSEIVSFWEE